MASPASRDEIAAAQFDAIETELARGEIDQPLHHEHHFGPPGAAVGSRRRGVAHHAAGAEMRGRHAIDARHDLDALLDHREVAGARAEIADIVTAHSQEITLVIERELRLHREIAALIVAEQRFTAVGCPFHRTADPARGPGNQHLFRENLAAGAEISADVADDQPELVVWHAERSRELAVRDVASSRCRCRACSLTVHGVVLGRARHAAPWVIRPPAAPKS